MTYYTFRPKKREKKPNPLSCHAPGLDSDLDFVVVVGRSPLPRYRRSQIARGFAVDMRFPKDIIVLTREEWKRGLHSRASLPSTVVREGKLLYGS